MRLKHLIRAAIVLAALGALTLPASSFGIANVYHQDDALPDYDVRSGKLAPTRAQKAAVKRLNARVMWNRFGTPSSLSRRGKFLSKAVRGKTAVEAARRWLYRNPQTHLRCNVFLERMMELRKSKFLDKFIENTIENAYYYCKPPPASADRPSPGGERPHASPGRPPGRSRRSRGGTGRGRCG